MHDHEMILTQPALLPELGEFGVGILAWVTSWQEFSKALDVAEELHAAGAGAESHTS